MIPPTVRGHSWRLYLWELAGLSGRFT